MTGFITLTMNLMILHVSISQFTDEIGYTENIRSEFVFFTLLGSAFTQSCMTSGVHVTNLPAVTVREEGESHQDL